LVRFCGQIRHVSATVSVYGKYVCKKRLVRHPALGHLNGMRAEHRPVWGTGYYGKEGFYLSMSQGTDAGKKRLATTALNMQDWNRSANKGG
jgi:hypothetical protein